MPSDLSTDVLAVQAIETVPTILETVASITGLRFVCIARVTDDSWTTCAVLDYLNFGLEPGDDLDVATTLCENVRDTGQMIVIDHVKQDTIYANHPTPKMYGFQSYISVPIFRPNGDYFGTLCGLDPQPMNLSTTGTIKSLTMFAQLISLQLSNEVQLAKVKEALLDERETAELREQFIAVLGHDLRNPLSAILNATALLTIMPDVHDKALAVVRRIERSAKRIEGLVDDVVDFTRGRMGGGIGLTLCNENAISAQLEQVVTELSYAHPERSIQVEVEDNLALVCDKGRISQLLSNLLKNALVHGDSQQPIKVSARVEGDLFKLVVINGGPALPQATINQLFKPFWRVSTPSINEGLGLGLFIVFEIAQSHQGKIEVVSTDEATSFEFTMRSANFVERRLNHISSNLQTERRGIKE